jgi:hypothetical protein
VNVVEAMESGGRRDHASGCLQILEGVALRKITHEVINTAARWRDVAANRDIVLWFGSPRPWLHGELSAIAAYSEHFLRRVAIEFEMQPFDEVD